MALRYILSSPVTKSEMASRLSNKLKRKKEMTKTYGGLVNKIIRAIISHFLETLPNICIRSTEYTNI